MELFDPKKVPDLIDTYGDEFRAIYEQAEADGLQEKQVEARELYQRMMRALAETGNGWMTFKDSANRKCNQTGPGSTGETNARDRVVHLSNLCTEILEVTSQSETAVCNLGSVNLGKFVTTIPSETPPTLNSATSTKRHNSRPGSHSTDRSN